MKCSEFLQELTNYLDGATRRSDQGRIRGSSGLVPQLLCGLRHHQEDHRDLSGLRLYELPDDLRTRLRSAIMSKCQAKKVTQESF